MKLNMSKLIHKVSDIDRQYKHLWFSMGKGTYLVHCDGNAFIRHNDYNFQRICDNEIGVELYRGLRR